MRRAKSGILDAILSGDGERSARLLREHMNIYQSKGGAFPGPIGLSRSVNNLLHSVGIDLASTLPKL